MHDFAGSDGTEFQSLQFLKLVGTSSTYVPLATNTAGITGPLPNLTTAFPKLTHLNLSDQKIGGSLPGENANASQEPLAQVCPE